MNATLKKEKKLLLSAQKDKEKYGELYEYYVNDVYRFSYSLLLNKQEAEDITSQVFLEFYKKLDSFKWQGYSLKSWLFKSTRYLIYNGYRRKPMSELNENEHSSQEHEISFVDQIIQNDLIQKVQEEIETLDILDREIINLRIWEGMKFKEISSIQGANENSIKQRFYRSIEKVRKNLDAKGHAKLYALPVLFTAIYKVGQAPSYACTEVSKGAFLIKSKNIMNNENNLNEMANSGSKTFLTSSVAKIGMIVGGIAIIVSAGVVGYLTLINDSDEYNNQEETTQTDENRNKSENTPNEVEPTSEFTNESDESWYEEASFAYGEDGRIYIKNGVEKEGKMLPVPNELSGYSKDVVVGSSVSISPDSPYAAVVYAVTTSNIDGKSQIYIYTTQIH